MKKRISFNQILVGALAIVFIGLGIVVDGLFNAERVSAFGLSPMNQVVVLNPGETYRDTLTIINTGDRENEFNYKITVQPFDMNGKMNVFDSYSDHTQIVDWITIIGDEEGSVEAGETKEFEYIIEVPEDAPAGGQYAAITITANNEAGGESEGFGLNENMAIAHLVYAEITGETVRQGEILDASVPGFLFSGSISGNSTIKNTGNVHGKAKYTLKVFPLFSDEELYTNEEEPEVVTILPDRELYNESFWNETPMIGVFNVIYTVEFEGVTTEVSKLVIKCPIWLLFVILAVIAALVIWIVMKIRFGKKKSKKSEE